RTLEILTTAVGVTIGAAVFLFAPIIATTWLKYRTLDPATVEWAVRLMGVGIACQWPSLLYSGGYVGLGRQGALAALRIVGLTVQWAGAAIALWAVGPRVELFFAWQIFSFALLSAMLGVHLWRLLAASPAPARFELGTVRRVA